jgi:hypothetical protein
VGLDGVERLLEPVAHRGPAVGRQRRQPVPHGRAVGGRLHQRLRLAGEDHQPDLEALGQPVEEAAGGLPRRLQPGRLDVVGVHRPRHVQHQHHRGLLAGDGDPRHRLGRPEQQRGQRQQQQRGRQPAPAALLRDHPAEHVEGRVAHGVAGAAAACQDQGENGERDQEECEQRQRAVKGQWPLPAAPRALSSPPAATTLADRG